MIMSLDRWFSDRSSMLLRCVVPVLLAGGRAMGYGCRAGWFVVAWFAASGWCGERGCGAGPFAVGGAGGPC